MRKSIDDADDFRARGVPDVLGQRVLADFDGAVAFDMAIHVELGALLAVGSIETDAAMGFLQESNPVIGASLVNLSLLFKPGPGFREIDGAGRCLVIGFTLETSGIGGIGVDVVIHAVAGDGGRPVPLAVVVGVGRALEG